MDCFEAVRRAASCSGASPCLLLPGLVEGPSFDFEHNGQSRDIFKWSLFKQASSGESCPSGGIYEMVYVNQVYVVYQNDAGPVEPFRVAMIYAAAGKTEKDDNDEAAVEAYVQYLAHKVDSVIRISLSHGHTPHGTRPWRLGLRLAKYAGATGGEDLAR